MNIQITPKSIFSFIITLFMFLSSMDVLMAQTDGDWILQSEKNGVKLYFRTDNCGNTNMLFLKFENSNSTAKHVNCNIIIESPVRNMPLLPLSVNLEGNETKSGECNSNKELSTDIKNITNLKMVVVMTTN